MPAATHAVTLRGPLLPVPTTPPRARRAARLRDLDEVLAVDGGPAVRSVPLPGPYPGALLIGRAEEKQVLEVLRSKSLFRYYGPNVLGKATALERRLAMRFGLRHALATASGTSALKCALFGAGVRAGDAVLIPAYSYVASADVVLSLGARPVFVEVDASMTMDPADLEAKIAALRAAGTRIGAVTVVHLFGVAADMERVVAITRAAGLPLVEDCAQSLGALYKGDAVGTFGDVGITSFQLNKMITAGEGGAVFTSDEGILDRAVRLHDHGGFRGKSGGEALVGEGFRMNELSAAVLLAQLGRLDDILLRLRDAKRFLVDKLAGVPGIELGHVPDPEGDAGAGLLFFVRDAAQAERVVAALNAEGIRVLRQYGGKPIYAHEAIAAAGLGESGQCPRTEALAGRSVFLGLSTAFKKRDLQDIVRAIRKVMRVLA
jgi:8-amino-3,8-dideoxy-alpha-D-manno-octulosonate transaminase